MSRIRSVHPGLWTDERFASASPLARLLFIGIWTECDDQGSFEWSPIKLKMRLLPVDNADVAALLSELEADGMVMSYELEGRKLGAVRNFCRYQRPKKPNSTYPQSDEVRNYCGFQAPPVPQKGEKPPQMEDGGGRVIPFSNENGSSPDADKVFWDSAKAYLGKGKASLIGQWVRDFGKEATAQAITAAQLERAVDPPGYIAKTLGRQRQTASGALSVPC